MLNVGKGRPPLPAALTGRFFVIEYRRGTDDYTILLDNERRDSFELGADIGLILRQFELWGQRDLGARAVDAARTFGGSQAILKDGRVVALFDRKPKPRPLFDAEQNSISLPALAGS